MQSGPQAFAALSAQHGLVQSSPQAAFACDGQAAFAPLGHAAAFLSHFGFSHVLASQFAASAQSAALSHVEPLSQSRVWVDEQPTISAESAMTLKSAIFFI